jgi:hypothetical protein
MRDAQPQFKITVRAKIRRLGTHFRKIRRFRCQIGTCTAEFAQEDSPLAEFRK